MSDDSQRTYMQPIPLAAQGKDQEPQNHNSNAGQTWPEHQYSLATEDPAQEVIVDMYTLDEKEESKPSRKGQYSTSQWTGSLASLESSRGHAQEQTRASEPVSALITNEEVRLASTDGIQNVHQDLNGKECTIAGEMSGVTASTQTQRPRADRLLLKTALAPSAVSEWLTDCASLVTTPIATAITDATETNTNSLQMLQGTSAVQQHVCPLTPLITTQQRIFEEDGELRAQYTDMSPDETKECSVSKDDPSEGVCITDAPPNSNLKMKDMNDSVPSFACSPRTTMTAATYYSSIITPQDPRSSLIITDDPDTLVFRTTPVGGLVIETNNGEDVHTPLPRCHTGTETDSEISDWIHPALGSRQKREAVYAVIRPNRMLQTDREANTLSKTRSSSHPGGEKQAQIGFSGCGASTQNHQNVQSLLENNANSVDTGPITETKGRGEYDASRNNQPLPSSSGQTASGKSHLQQQQCLPPFGDFSYSTMYAMDESDKPVEGMDASDQRKGRGTTVDLVASKDDVHSSFPKLAPAGSSSPRRSLIIQWPDKPHVPALKGCWELLMEDVRQRKSEQEQFGHQIKSVRENRSDQSICHGDLTRDTIAHKLTDLDTGEFIPEFATTRTVKNANKLLGNALLAGSEINDTDNDIIMSVPPQEAARRALELEKQRWTCESLASPMTVIRGISATAAAAARERDPLTTFQVRYSSNVLASACPAQQPPPPSRLAPKPQATSSSLTSNSSYGKEHGTTRSGHKGKENSTKGAQSFGHPSLSHASPMPAPASNTMMGWFNSDIVVESNML